MAGVVGKLLKPSPLNVFIAEPSNGDCIQGHNRLTLFRRFNFSIYRRKTSEFPASRKKSLFAPFVVGQVEEMDDSTMSNKASRRLRTLASHLHAEGGDQRPIFGCPTAANADSDFTRSKQNKASIAAERSKARFDVKEMAHVIDGGKAQTEVRAQRKRSRPFFSAPFRVAEY